VDSAGFAGAFASEPGKITFAAFAQRHREQLTPGA
jgi:hypothetical protein